MIQINTEILRALKPCEERFDNYLEHYKDFDGTWDEFLDLPKISYEDRLWVMQEVFNKNQAVHFAILCAEHCSDNFNKLFPEDKRLIECFEYLKSIPDYSNLTLEETSKIKFHESAARSAIIGFLKIAGIL